MRRTITPALLPAVVLAVGGVATAAVLARPADAAPTAQVQQATTHTYRFDIALSKMKQISNEDAGTHPIMIETGYTAHQGALRAYHGAGIEVPGGGPHILEIAAVNLAGGQIVYAASTGNQDDTTYAILGGTGKFVGATGTVAYHALNRQTVRVTIKVR